MAEGKEQRSREPVFEGRIFLVGFMGAGKTTVGRELARLLGCSFVDLDDVTCQRAGKTVREIFSQHGEAEFRRLESDAIASCRDIERGVIALGGGAFISEENRAILKSLGKSVWLDCPLEVCLRRLGEDPSRPLLTGRDEMVRLFDRRRHAYSLADYRVQDATLSPREVALGITSLLGL